MDIQRLKQLTGGDRVSARFLYQGKAADDLKGFYPDFHLTLFTNTKPIVIDSTDAAWRRIRVVPFVVQFKGEKRDNSLKQTIAAEAEGILAWLVRGCMAWQKRGLAELPKAVRDATAEYELDSDVLAEFVDMCCAVESDAMERAHPLYVAYKAWCEERGRDRKEIVTETTFGRMMAAKFRKDHDRAGYYYTGLRLAGNVTGSQIRCDGFDGFLEKSRARVRTPEEFTENDTQPVTQIQEPVTPNIDGWHDERDAVLGMTSDDALAIWKSQGAPSSGPVSGPEEFQFSAEVTHED
jgi:phage/plasmid-associated DNA primase